MFARTTPEPVKTRVVAQCRDADFERLVRSTFGMDAKVELTITLGTFAAEVRKLDTAGATVVIVDIDPGSEADFSALNALTQRLGGTPPVIVAIPAFDVSVARQLLQMRVADFVVKPVAPLDLVRACARAAQGAKSAGASEAKIFTFLPASGGVGLTTLAIEAAMLLLKGDGQKSSTCLVDLDFQHGSCCDYLDLEPRLDLDEIEPRPDRLDRQLLEVMISHHSSGLQVIAAPSRPAEMRSFDFEVVTRLLDLVASHFDNVVIDVPRTWFAWTDSVLIGSNRLFLVTEMTVPGLKHARHLVNVIRERLTDGPRPEVIVNRFEQRLFGPGLRRADIEQALGDSLRCTIPNNFRLVSEAIDRGVPLGEVKAGNNISQALAKLVHPPKNAKAAIAAVPAAGERKLAVARCANNLCGLFTATRRIAEVEAAVAAAATPPVVEAPSLQMVQELPKLEPTPEPAPSISPLRDKLLDAKVRLHRRLIEEINLSAIEKISEGEVRRQISALVAQYVLAERIALNAQELDDFVDEIIDEMTGLGPIEPLLKDPTINDILINGHECVYIERAGMLEPTPVRFKDEAHLLRIVNKIVSAVGRRVDESQPLCDARLLDGSRINIAVRPIAVDGPLVSIRKFSKKPYNMKKLIDIGALKPAMGEVLAAAVNARITTIISGGTGSGKTTMLNALSAFISDKERLVTIEDAAELQLQQPHVGRMETRPPNVEGKGEIRQRELVKNALRMRPDRIILGECRGEEAFDMLQAMNTGHEGSMATIHANTPRDAISRLEQMIGMAGMPMTIASVRGQISAAIRVIVQLQRLSDGKRRVTSIAEITGLEGDILQMQEIYKYVRTGTAADGTVEGHFQATGVRPRFLSELVARGINIPGAYFDPSKSL